MIGITAFAAAIPAYRVARDTIASAWETRSLGGRLAAHRFDEDSLTLASSAAADCLSTLPGKTAGGLYFASTTAPFLERLNAGLIAAFLDLPAEVRTADFANSLRAGLFALGAATDAVAAGRSENVIVAAADTRNAPAGGDEEQFYGDGAAAIAIGSANVLAEIVSRGGVSDDFLETVRRDRDDYVTSFASKFTSERGYAHSMAAAIRKNLQQTKLEPAQISRLVLSSPDKGAHLALAKRFGFQPAQVQDTAWDQLGVTGTAMPLLLLAAALENAKPGEYILVAAHGDGAGAMILRATEALAGYRPRAGFAQQLASAIEFRSYAKWRKSRDYLREQDDTLEVSNIWYAKEETQTVRLRGVECGHCGTRQLQHQLLCPKCHKTDAIKEVPLARTGAVFTFAVDQLFPSPFPPTAMAVVDLDGGGRIYCEVVDCDPDKVQIGLPVELTIRRLKEGGGLHHYYWKCRPRRF
jgi:hydroxymethylglutaryl-CoA synthase